MTRKQWEYLEGKLVHMTIIGITPWGEDSFIIDCHIHETDNYFEFNVDVDVEVSE